MQDAKYGTQELLDFIVSTFHVAPENAASYLASAFRSTSGNGHGSVREYLNRGWLTDSTADRWAIALGVHPAHVWGNQWWQADEASGLLGLPEVAETVGVTVDTLRHLAREDRWATSRSLRGIPRPVRMERRWVWRAPELDAWLAGLQVEAA